MSLDLKHPRLANTLSKIGIPHAEIWQANPRTQGKPNGTDTLKYSVYPGYEEYFRDEKGRSTAVAVVQPEREAL